MCEWENMNHIRKERKNNNGATIQRRARENHGIFIMMYVGKRILDTLSCVPHAVTAQQRKRERKTGRDVKKKKKDVVIMSTLQKKNVKRARVVRISRTTFIGWQSIDAIRQTERDDEHR